MWRFILKIVKQSSVLCIPQVDVARIALPSGKMIPANKFGGDMDTEQHSLQLTPDEEEIQRKARLIWNGVLNVEIEDSTDFFECGAGSMDVVRSVSIEVFKTAWCKSSSSVFGIVQYVSLMTFLIFIFGTLHHRLMSIFSWI